MTKIAYFDCFSGASGDMILGALLDAGLDLKALEDGLAGLGFSGFRLTATKVMRSSISATKFDVVIDKEHHHHHRSLSHILHHIGDSSLPGPVKEKASDIFRRLGAVEAGIHNVPVEDVHFHEVGAVDSIVDIVGTVLGLHVLGIERCYASPLPAGSGSVQTEHGRLPAPAPATLQILAEAGAPLRPGDEPGRPQAELVTPTGAALITSLATFGQPGMSVTGAGYGAGGRDFPGWPNVLRVWLGEQAQTAGTAGMTLLETNIDDMNPQVYGYLMEKLFDAGAADVWYTPIQMKKDRPAVMLSVLAPASEEPGLTDIIMRETTTLGIRVRPVERRTAERRNVEVETSLGAVSVKIKEYKGDVLSVTPEYDDVRKIAAEKDLPYNEVRRIVSEEARRTLLHQGP